MKIYFWFITYVLVLASCTQKNTPLAYQPTGEVKCLEHDDRTLKLQVRSVGSTFQDAAFYADVSAFENIFYKGIPNSNQELPLLGSRNEMRGQVGYFESFFNSGDYMKFVTEQQVVSHSESNSSHFVEKNITIDLFALRRDLEQAKIIKKFGIQ